MELCTKISESRNKIRCDKKTTNGQTRDSKQLFLTVRQAEVGIKVVMLYSAHNNSSYDSRFLNTDNSSLSKDIKKYELLFPCWWYMPIEN